MSLGRVRTGARLLTIEYPEFWVAGLCVTAWVALVWLAYSAGARAELCEPFGVMRGMSGLGSPVRAARGFAEGITMPALHWLLMLAAMMVPALMGSLRTVAARSFWARRHRAMALVLVGYVAPWLVFGCVMEFVRTLVPARAALPLMVGAFGCAAVWQLTPAKRRSLTGCHREPLLPPSGWRADAACVRFGAGLAGRCWLSCWALMLACAAGGHALWTTALVSAVVWVERFRPRLPMGWSTAALSVAGMLVWAGLLAG